MSLNPRVRSMAPVTVHFLPADTKVSAEPGSTVISAIRAAGIPFGSLCGGTGKCGKCRVILSKGTINRREDACEKFLTREECARGYCLACSATIESDAVFLIPAESRIAGLQILVSGREKFPDVTPRVRKYLLKTEDRGFSVLGGSCRLEGYPGKKPGVPTGILEEIRRCPGDCTAIVSEGDGIPAILAVEPGDTRSGQYGVAIDLGTSTLAGLLADLRTGEIRARASHLNRQITYGEELISRIVHARTPEGLETLRSADVESISLVEADLLGQARVRQEDVIDLQVSGNTVMMYLLAGLSPAPLEFAGGPVVREPIRLQAKEAGVPAHPSAVIHGLPCVSRFIGGDAVGDVLVAGMAGTPDISLLLDLGTNGEIILGNRDFLVSASCASGPAFEGAGLKCGMRAMLGAIDHVDIEPSSGKPVVSVIGSGLPLGICGSGIIDAGAGMASAGIIDRNGKIAGRWEYVRRGPDGPEFILVPGTGSGTRQDIVITARDMQYLMDSKAAVCGGVLVLMKKYRVFPEMIRHVYLAGAFGTYGNRENLRRLGIIPELPSAEFHLLGNGSLSGAFAALVSGKARDEAAAIAGRMTYIDLLVDPDFPEAYSEALRIPEPGTRQEPCSR